jgi:type I restriction enzyme S subunit
MATLEEICSHVVDCKNRTAPIDPDGEFFAVGTPAMRGNVINFAEARRINKDTFDEWTQRLLPKPGDILFAREAPVGPVVAIPAGDNIAAGQRTMLLRTDPAKADSVYLRLYLSSPTIQARILSLAHGSTTPHLRVADVRSFPVELPPLAEQRAIAEVLAALDHKIAANTKLAQRAGSLLEARFWALGLNRDPNEDETIVGLGELVELNPKLAAPTEAEPVYVDMQKVPVSNMSISDWEHRPAKGGARFMNGDTLLARITPCLENRKTGFVDFLEEDQIGVGSTEFIVLRSRPGIPVALSYFLATSQRFRTFAIRHMVGTSGRQRVSALDLTGYTTGKPSESELAKFGDAAVSTFPLVKSLTDESRTLTATRDVLLPQLMSGKLRVKDAEAALEKAGV